MFIRQRQWKGQEKSVPSPHGLCVGRSLSTVDVLLLSSKREGETMGAQSFSWASWAAQKYQRELFCNRRERARAQLLKE